MGEKDAWMHWASRDGLLGVTILELIQSLGTLDIEGDVRMLLFRIWVPEWKVVSTRQ